MAMSKIVVEEITKDILTGELDEYLGVIASAIGERRNALSDDKLELIREKLNRRERVEVYFNNRVKPHYLQGIHADVLRIRGDKLELLITDTRARRFRGSTTSAASLIDLV